MHTILTALALVFVAMLIAGTTLIAHSIGTAISEEDLYKTSADGDGDGKEKEAGEEEAGEEAGK